MATGTCLPLLRSVSGNQVFVPMLLITFHIRLSTGRSLREFPEIQQNGVLLFLGSKHFTSRRKKLDKNEKDMSHRTIIPY
ncbi:hypothetical protein BDV30DRAFT_212409 [Aspergillus minisclerotigenes]|uniref:Uncharacterized protein n=1 Tax=Aspergillus minisclerotigenes TaxID=656917 RepID=A0A5N6J243_9EURO|nr:hypothetical protein BDV30DRAFT_212409 [Aspergillus minisclerotigenes]